MPKARFPFAQVGDELGVASYMPYVPLTLHYRHQTVEVMGLLDTGATVNVLPYHVGEQLGAVWEQ